MITDTDALNTIEFDDYFVILPSTPLWDTADFCANSSQTPGRHPPFGFRYNSGENPSFLSIDELKQLIAADTHD
jgi:UDP-N-acetylglucosamine 4,6-dehydratase/5-epimerase